MGAAREPLEKILDISTVRASFVFGPGGDVVARREQASQGALPSIGQLGAVARHMGSSNQGITETILFYPDALFLFRKMGEYVLVIAGDSQTVPSLLRVTVEVSEHEWRERGLERVFPKGKGGEAGPGGWRKLFGKR